MSGAVTLPPHVDDVNRFNSVTSARLLVNVQSAAEKPDGF